MAMKENDLHESITAAMVKPIEHIATAVERVIDRHIRESGLVLIGDTVTLVLADDKSKDYRLGSLVAWIKDDTCEYDELVETISALETVIARLRVKQKQLNVLDAG